MIDIEKFMRDGWIIVDVPAFDRPQHYFKDIHKKNYTDEQVKEKHIRASEHFWKDEPSMFYANKLMPFISQLIGLDILVQYYPYFRIARPHKPQDNIGFHKDTQYGQKPYELAVHIPFVDLDERSALQVISGSHLMPESNFQAIESEEVAVDKGSIENKIGRPYAPKRLMIPDGMQTTPMCVKVGQAAIFSPALFHGQEVNEGDVTRVSCDLRFVSALHADEVRLGKVHAGYLDVSISPVEVLAKEYFYANQMEFS